MADSLRFKILGRYWTIEFVDGRQIPGRNGEAFQHKHQTDGSPDAARTGPRRIKIWDKLSGQKLLDAIIHEVTHAANWSLDETFVTEFAHDLAKVLWRLRHRLITEEDEE